MFKNVSKTGSWYTAINVFVIAEQFQVLLLSVCRLQQNPTSWASDALKIEFSYLVQQQLRVTGNQSIPIQ